LKRILETILKEVMYNYFSSKESNVLIIDQPIIEEKLSDQLLAINKKKVLIA
jgi:ATP-dependent protease Clp ATPase subunit